MNNDRGNMSEFTLADIQVGDVITIENRMSFIVVYPSTIGFSNTQHIDTLTDLWEDNLTGQCNRVSKKKVVFDIIEVSRDGKVIFERSPEEMEMK